MRNEISKLKQIWQSGDAGKAVAVLTTAAVAVLGTIPAVGGYSNIGPSDDFTTVGIVTQVQGGAFMLSSAALAGGASEAEAVAEGKGVVSGDRIWVEPAGLVRLTDTDGGRMTIAGPASVEFLRKGRGYAAVHVFKGSVKFHSTEMRPMHFENALVDGSVAGEGALWASDDLVQVLGLTGDVRAWHPQLAQAAVLVVPGFFSESSGQARHLQPSRPLRADESRFEDFLSRFEEGSRPLPLAAAHEADRALASATSYEGAARTSRAELHEKPDAHALARIRAHITGHAIDEAEAVEKPLTPRAPRFNGFGSRGHAHAGFVKSVEGAPESSD